MEAVAGMLIHSTALRPVMKWTSAHIHCVCSICKCCAATVVMLKTSSGKVVATSFLCLIVHRWIAGDVPIYLKFALKVTHPFRKTPTDFA